MATKYYTNRPFRYRKKHYRPGEEVTSFTSIWGYRRLLHTAVVLAASTLAAAEDLDTVPDGEDTIYLYFTPAPEDPHAPTLGYQISDDEGETWSDAAVLEDVDGLSYILITGLDWTQNYTYRLRGVNKVGVGAESEDVTQPAWD